MQDEPSTPWSHGCAVQPQPITHHNQSTPPSTHAVCFMHGSFHIIPTPQCVLSLHFLPLLQDADPSQPYYVEVQKIAAPGGPIFSVAPLRNFAASDHSPGGQAAAASTTTTADGSRVPAVPTIFCGNAAKEVVSWQPFMPSFTDVGGDGRGGDARLGGMRKRLCLQAREMDRPPPSCRCSQTWVGWDGVGSRSGRGG